MGGPLDFGVVIFMGNVITRKAPRRIHAGDRRRVEVIIRVPMPLVQAWSFFFPYSLNSQSLELGG